MFAVIMQAHSLPLNTHIMSNHNVNSSHYINAANVKIQAT